MKKYLMLSLIVVLVISMLSIGVGCKEPTVVTETVVETVIETVEVEKTAEEEADMVPEITDEPITIYLWLISGVSGKKWRNWAEFYKAEHPNVTFVSNEFAFADLGTLGEAALAGKTEDMDLLWYTGGAFVNNWAKAGLIKNLDEYYEYYGWEDKKLETSKLYKTPGLGWYHIADAGIIDPTICYNKDILTELGLEVPKTLDEFFETLDIIKTTSDYVPFLNGDGAKRHWRLTGNFMLRLMGQEKYEEMLFWGEDPNKSAETAEIFRSSEVVEAIKMSLEMHNKGYYPEGHMGADSSENLSMFVNGKAVFYSNVVAYIKSIIDSAPEGFNFGTMVIPPVIEGDPAPYAAQLASGVVIPEYISDEKLAILMDLSNEAATNKRYIDETFLTEGVLSPSNLYTTGELNAILPAQTAEVVGNLNNPDIGASFALDHWMDPGLRAYYEDMIYRVFVGEITPEEAAEGLYKAAVATIE